VSRVGGRRCASHRGAVPAERATTIVSPRKSGQQGAQRVSRLVERIDFRFDCAEGSVRRGPRRRRARCRATHAGTAKAARPFPGERGAQRVAGGQLRVGGRCCRVRRSSRRPTRVRRTPRRKGGTTVSPDLGSDRRAGSRTRRSRSPPRCSGTAFRHVELVQEGAKRRAGVTIEPRRESRKRGAHYLRARVRSQDPPTGLVRWRERTEAEFGPFAAPQPARSLVVGAEGSAIVAASTGCVPLTR
jgi:hypothetical protein